MGKLCKDQLADKLVPLFENAEDIEGAVREAQNRLVIKVKQAKREGLESLFDNQLEVLRDMGWPDQVIEMFRNQRGNVISKASGMTFTEGCVPFLPVTPWIYRSVYDQIQAVKNKDKTGYNHLDPAEISNTEKTPEKPYYIYDVEDGKAMLGKSLKDAEKLMKKDGRHPLTVEEVIILDILGSILMRHNIDATGSQYEAHKVPFLVPFLNLDHGRPMLDASYDADFANDEWGAGSCGSRD